MTPAPAISIRDLSKRYGSVQALDGVSLDIAPGEFFGLLGPNGAGKTTLINALAGLARPDAGHIEVMGHDVITDYRAARAALGVVPQELVFDPFFTVRETLRLQSGYFGVKNNDDWVDEILSELDLTGKANANMRSLSGGMKRRVLVAQALVHRPPVIVLDEPTAGVDVELRQGLWHFVQKLNRAGHTILLTTHYLEEAEALCGRIAMLKAGRVVSLDTTANLLGRTHRHTLSIRLQAGAVLPQALQTPGGGAGPAYSFTLDHLDEVGEILSALRDAAIQIEDMEITKPDLEEVFLDVMKAAS